MREPTGDRGVVRLTGEDAVAYAEKVLGDLTALDHVQEPFRTQIVEILRSIAAGSPGWVTVWSDGDEVRPVAAGDGAA